MTFQTFALITSGHSLTMRYQISGNSIFVDKTNVSLLPKQKTFQILPNLAICRYLECEILRFQCW